MVLIRDVLGVGSNFGSLGFVNTRRVGVEFLLFREGEEFEECSIW